jgi:aconitase A
VSGSIEPAKVISLSVDQTLMHDATGQMAALEFEALSIPRIKIKLAVTDIDQNTLQVEFENADDHIFLQTFHAKYGLHFSRAGNGICHPVHLERVDPSFVERIKELGGGFVVAGNNDGQESSREHAALAPMFLGVKAVIAKSFARIHLANLINFGVLPFNLERRDRLPKSGPER